MLITSLTSPSDRNSSDAVKGERVGPPLTDTETTEAMKELYINDHTKFRRLERVYCDPGIEGQTFALHSFVPSRGATPDKDGIFGFIKIRGVFSKLEDANKKAEELIRNVDSYHHVLTSYVGRPFPISQSSRYALDTNEIDLKNKVKEVYTEDVKSKREDEVKAVKEIQEKEKRLKEDVSKEEAPDDRYTTLKVKRAQLIWTYHENQKKLKEIVDIIRKAEKEIEEMDKESSEYKKKYYEKYMTARREAGLPDDDESFIKYMAQDIVFEPV